MQRHETPSRDVERVESPTSSLPVDGRAVGEALSRGAHEQGAEAPAVLAERWYPDWRKRLAGNLSRRSETHWDPLTYRDAVSERLVDQLESGRRS